MCRCESVRKEVLNSIQRNAHVIAELLGGEHLVWRFVQGVFNLVDQSAAVAFAFSGNALDVFWVDADPGNSGFHDFVFATQRFENTTDLFR